MEHVHRYYSPGNLFNTIIDGLKKAGKDPSLLTLDDLQPVDEFHIRGSVATIELIQLSRFLPEMHILEVGCGIGGSARRLAHAIGCRVTGIDLSKEYIEVAEKLTELLAMQDKVSFLAASALSLPYQDNSFDGVWSIQMNMNIEDKSEWLAEIYRVLKPGSSLVLYEVCGGVNSPIYFPVPWAQDEGMSSLVNLEVFRQLICDVGFSIDTWNDKTTFARQAFANMQQPVGEPNLPELGVHMLVGNDILTKAYNLHRNLEEERVTLIELLATKS